jgi:hypothetical protein
MPPQAKTNRTAKLQADWYPFDIDDLAPPPLSEWLMRTFQRMHRTRLVAMIASTLRVSEPTVRKGGPSQRNARRRMLARLQAHMANGAGAADEHYLRRIEALTAGVEKNMIATFSAALAWHEDPLVFELCQFIDMLNTAMMFHRISAMEADTLICEAAANTGVFHRPSALSPAPDAVALNVMLMLLAQLDHALRRRYADGSIRPRPLFLSLTPKPATGRQPYRSPTRRYIDHLYAYAFACCTWKKAGRATMPKKLPTIMQLEEKLGQQQASGARSRVVYWRDTSKALYLEDVDEIMDRTFGEYSGAMRAMCVDMYFAAMFWESVAKHAPERVDWAVSRYREWWRISLSDDPETGDEPDPYWALV